MKLLSDEEEIDEADKNRQDDLRKSDLLKPQIQSSLHLALQH